MGTVASTRVRRSSSASAAAAPESSPTSTLAPQLVRALLPCEIRVVDEETREIEVCATSEAVDAHGTIFAYDASKDAFARWVGNVREMHERKAVGRKVAVRNDDAARRVYVRLRISKGAEDTWEKVKDGTLAGASIGASNVEWRRQRVNGADIPVATHYDLVELSLVDAPSNGDAAGISFVRIVANGAPDDALLSDLSSAADATSAPSAAPSTSASTVIREQAGALSDEDPALAIAQAALARGQAQVQAQIQPSVTQNAARNAGANGEFRREADVAAGQTDSGLTANERRLAALGAPTYVERARQGVKNAAAMEHPTRADDAPGAMFDVDGDHDGSGDAASGAGLEHADELHAHAAHDHPHSGVYDDRHVHAGAHQHLDGTSHTHDHAHDHGHHDHQQVTSRASSRAVDEMSGLNEGHSHAHVHTHDHGHYYRVADGSPRDERLVTGEQLRTREYVSELAFRAAGGVAGTGLSAAQYRIAAGIETRLELAAAERAQGAFSRNPLGAADIGTPAEAAETSTDAAIAASATGQVNDLDRDGQPTTCDDVSSTGTLDVSAPPDGFMELTEQRTTPATAAPSQRWEPERALVAEITASVSAEVARVTSALGDIQQRLARIEAQPQAGGPALRIADRTSALAASSGSASSVEQRIEALGALRGRIVDPQAQVAVAAEMIRLQQEAAGMPASMQVMPRAGRGWGEQK